MTNFEIILLLAILGIFFFKVWMRYDLWKKDPKLYAEWEEKLP